MIPCPRCIGGQILGDSSWQSCLLCGHVVVDSGRIFSGDLLSCLYGVRPDTRPKMAKLEPIDWLAVRTRYENPSRLVSYDPSHTEYWQGIRAKYQASTVRF